MGRGNIVDLSNNDADFVSIDLKKRFMGQQIAKRAIRVFYKLPHNRAVNVWEILMNRGFIVTNRDVIVPRDDPAPEVVKNG